MSTVKIAAFINANNHFVGERYEENIPSALALSKDTINAEIIIDISQKPFANIPDVFHDNKFIN